jgi:hypothetical protein
MNRWPISVLACVVLCGCQLTAGPAAPVSNMDCPTPSPCDDSSSESWMPAKSAPVAVVALAAYKPFWPGCPTTLQVMARPAPRPIAFKAVRPEEPETAPDPSDWVCDPPEAPLLRAGRQPVGQGLASR